MPTRREVIKAIVGTLPVREVVTRISPEDTEPPMVRHVKVPVPGLDRRLDGLRIGQLSDVHIGAALLPDYLARCVRVWARNPPELLAVTGDLLDDGTMAGACMGIMSQVRAPFGRFYSLGNHENFSGREEIIRAGRSQDGVRLLVNEATRQRVDGVVMHISGVDFPVGQGASAPRNATNAAYVAETTRTASDADFRLCLAHHPDDFDEIRARGVELTLSGHTHGGQIAPIGPWLMKRLYKYPRGLYREGASHLYVSSGTGHSLPLRVGIPAEITELTLVRV